MTWTRVEARVGAGLPDINGAMKSGEFWIESKVISTKKFSTVGLWRPSQVAWQFSRSKTFPNVWNLVSHPASEKLCLYSGTHILDLNDPDAPLVDPCLVMTYPVNWNAMIEYISGSLIKMNTSMDYERANV